MGQIEGVEPVISEYILDWCKVAQSHLNRRKCKNLTSIRFVEMLEFKALGDKSNVIVTPREIELFAAAKKEFLQAAFPNLLNAPQPRNSLASKIYNPDSTETQLKSRFFTNFVDSHRYSK
ncbi:hypothetical protein AAKU58_004365 [Oxalobacteraceae bacterium GrIS 1.18]